MVTKLGHLKGAQQNARFYWSDESWEGAKPTHSILKLCDGKYGCHLCGWIELDRRDWSKGLEEHYITAHHVGAPKGDVKHEASGHAPGCMAIYCKLAVRVPSTAVAVAVQ